MVSLEVKNISLLFPATRLSTEKPGSKKKDWAKVPESRIDTPF
nr:Putative uncharacterized protein [Moritella viscosa]